MTEPKPYPAGFNIPPPDYHHHPPPPQYSVHPPPPYVQPQPQPQVVTRTVIPVQFLETPLRMTCPNCRHEVMTETSLDCSILQHAACFIMCITTAFLFCSCVPYCIDNLYDVKHKCPNCHSHLGTYKRFF